MLINVKWSSELIRDVPMKRLAAYGMVENSDTGAACEAVDLFSNEEWLSQCTSHNASSCQTGQQSVVFVSQLRCSLDSKDDQDVEKDR